MTESQAENYANVCHSTLFTFCSSPVSQFVYIRLGYAKSSNCLLLIMIDEWQSVNFYIRLWEYLGVLPDHERSSMSCRLGILVKPQ